MCAPESGLKGEGWGEGWGEGGEGSESENGIKTVLNFLRIEPLMSRLLLNRVGNMGCKITTKDWRFQIGVRKKFLFFILKKSRIVAIIAAKVREKIV